MSEDIDAPSETDPSRAVMERLEEIAPCPHCGGTDVHVTEAPCLNAGGEKRLLVNVFCQPCSAGLTRGSRADAIAAWNRRPSPAPVAAEGKALGIALAALQHIQGMEPITHEITLPTVMANHAVDALKEIEELGATSCPNPCGECRGVVVAGKCDTCGWEVE